MFWQPDVVARYILNKVRDWEQEKGEGKRSQNSLLIHILQRGRKKAKKIKTPLFCKEGRVEILD